jgi:flagellar biosynthesis component FlhA
MGHAVPMEIHDIHTAVVREGRVHLDRPLSVPEGTEVTVVLCAAGAPRVRVLLGEHLLGHAAAIAERLPQTRRELAARTGVVLGPVSVRDDLSLSAYAYALEIDGETVAEGHLPADRRMVLSPEGASLPPIGVPDVEPAYGLEIRWVLPAEEAALPAGLLVFDAPTALTTHLGAVLSDAAPALLDLMALDLALRDHPALAAALAEAGITRVEALRWLRALLEAGATVSPLAHTLEAVLVAVTEARHRGRSLDAALAALAATRPRR